MEGHCGPGYDNDIGYRSDLEFEFWKQKDPIESLSQQLDSDQVKEVTNEIRDEIEAAFVFAENSSFAPSSSASENVYESTSATHEESHLHSCSQRVISFAEAIRESQDIALSNDQSVYLMGLGVPDPKGILEQP